MDRKKELDINAGIDNDSAGPSIGRVNVQTSGSSGGNDGWLKYIIAANASGVGSVIAFVLSAILFFPLGYYYKYKSVKNEGTEITQKATENYQITLDALTAIEDRNETLFESLRTLGFNEDEIALLIDGEKGTFERLKEKITKVLPGKNIPVYVPRTDCGNDYLGNSGSEANNSEIYKGFKNRASQQ